MTKNLIKFTAGKKFDSFLIQNCNLLIPRLSKLQEKKPLALRREQTFFLFLWVIFALLDPDPDPLT